MDVGLHNWCSQVFISYSPTICRFLVLNQKLNMVFKTFTKHCRFTCLMYTKGEEVQKGQFMDFLDFLLLYSKHFALPARVIKLYGYQIGFLRRNPVKNGYNILHLYVT